jgi:hypothetical protein
LGRSCSSYGGREETHRKILVGKPKGKNPFGRPRRRWENNIKIDLQDVDCGGMDWIDLAQNRESWRELLNVVTNFLVT